MNPRLKRTLQEIEVQRTLGHVKRRRRIPKQRPPIAIEREYTRALVGIAKRTSTAIKPLLDALPDLVASRNSDRADHMDAGEAGFVQRIIARIKALLVIDTAELEGLARTIGRATGNYSTGQLRKQIKAGIGVDIMSGDLATALEGFVAENVALVRSVPVQTLERIEGAVIRGLNAGHLHGDIAKEIHKATNLGLKRAKLIARDQVGKYYTAVQRERQTALGIERFTWGTTGDRRVRPAHEEINGNSYTWAEGHPTEGLPGEPVLCRCTGSPDLSGLLG